MTDVVRLSSARKHAKRIGPRDERVCRLHEQPPARTLQGERWHLNAFNMAQVVVVRQQGERSWRTNEAYHVVIGNFETVRDAACAMQGHNAFNLICDAFEIARTPEDFHDRVAEILKAFGRNVA